jgi:predicted phage baseplate assembly protein
LKQLPLTHRQVPPRPDSAAIASLRQDPRDAAPQLALLERGVGQDADAETPWTPVFDLLSSSPEDRHVVAEIDNEGVAHLRFGNGEMGARPNAGSRFVANYRIGNGVGGNVGAGAINRIRVADQSEHENLNGAFLQVDNPMPAQGGADAESLAEARLFAPSQFRKTLLRAITAADYAEVAGRDSRIQRAACELVWTGSWYEADVALDPFGSNTANADLMADIASELEKVRRMGHDLHIEPAVHVPIDLALDVCALPGYERGAIKAALLDHFGAGRQRDGTLGAFHPDRLSFGEGIGASRIVAEGMAVPGVECVTVTRLRRFGEPANHEIENGLLPLAAHEIARLDNDPAHPDAGQLSITVRGGR